MVKPLPLPKVQQIAGHLDIKTTMRYAHRDLINDTASLQLSRGERAAQKATQEEGTEPPPKRPFVSTQGEDLVMLSKANLSSIGETLR